MANFSWSVIGHQKIIDYLQSVIANNRLNHAYLFYGPEGLGKSLVADYFIKSVYCQSNDLPCGQCVFCRQIGNHVHPDVIYLQPQEDKKSITIEQVREARVKIYHASFLNSHKIIFIRQAHTLSIAASNALLKTLEEPTQKTIFIFLTPTLKNIPQTILSRVQIIKFLPVPANDLEKYLINKKFNKTDAYQLSHLAQGCPGRILPLLDHPKLLNEYKNKLSEILTQISADLNVRFKLVESLAGQTKSAEAKVKAKQFLNNLTILIRDALLIKNMCFDKVTHLDLKQQLTSLSSRYTSGQLAGLLNKIKLTQTYIDKNVNPRLALENLVLEL